ncbi:chain-length determining protein [Pseudomonas prosekii]|uniref:Chain-length determining protein n=3 Tax=Pseudomonas prosekii TaxID=1148509 RepID=A0A3L8CCS8_9PSED|nr:Wzz/FepE/Etk N-terminal domain-containing protein [Pseudomonas prosekii]RLU05618.1 chain-length determining protein [Pseudomonas prosekii]
MSVESKRPATAEGLDLYAVTVTLWRQKLVVLGGCLLGVLIAIAYLLIAQPVYEAKGFVIPPTQNDIEGLNYGRTPSNRLAPYTVKDVYSIFIKNLQAESLRREFFKDHYLPVSGASEDPKGSLYAYFSESLLISVVGKDVDGRYSVTLRYGDRELASKWVEQYIIRAGQLAVLEINKNISTEAGMLAKNLHQDIVSVREVGEKSREDAIIRLREALKVAKAIGLEKPPLINESSSASMNILGNMNGELAYMRGTIALEAEIGNLQNRQSDDPFLGKLRDLETQYSFYKQLEEVVPEARVYRADGIVESSGNPVKPKRAIILLAGIVLGLMFGAVMALVREAVTSSRGSLREA